ncbi:hypothetical protein AV926_18405 [Myroides marinus]|uniref:Phage abortive infection protein n=1 Tax=Myroides marinus TaxID=703342 RepID=A0A163UI72_9FLAO|nr:hypothetical protein [Myroides marinus]KZE73356.1 hypothetical protein AV926_18405 [Myroides marinus]
MKDNYLSYFIKIAAILVIISLVFPFAVNYFFSNWETSGTFGDTFGALNALFSGLALSGVIVTILIQKRELHLQQIEMQETRKEFLMNRTTNLIYTQLDRFEKALSELVITHNTIEYKGNDAISFLIENKELVLKYEKTDEQYKEEMKQSIIKLLNIYSPNKSQIEKFAHNAYNSVEVLKRLVYKSNLDIEEINDLKKLFFDNIGFVNMQVVEMISEVSENELEFLTTEDYIKNGLDVGKLHRANIFLKSIKDFYQLNLTSDNFTEHKNKWIHNCGDQA